jgi:hypothetical protein
MPSTIPTSLVFVSLSVIGLLFLLVRGWPWIKHRLFVHHEDTQGMIMARLSELILAVKEQTVWMKTPAPTEKDESGEITLGVLQEIRDAVAIFVSDHPAKVNPVDELREQLAKQHASELAALDSLNVTMTQGVKVQKAFLAMMYGQDGSGYSAMDEEAQALRETAERFRKVYNLDWDQAMERARNAAAIQTGPGMRDGV